MLEPGTLPDRSCQRCGSKILVACPTCGAQIRGAPYGSISYPGFKIPKFCRDCGAPYPWTSHQLERLKDEIQRRATEQGVAQGDADALKQAADAFANGTATKKEVDAAHSLTQKFGPAASMIWSGLSDIAAKVVVGLIRPY